MTATIQESTALAEQQRDALIEKLLDATAGVWTIFTVYLGDKLGLYRALAAGGSLTSTELASRTGTSERYVREWLEQQVVGGILAVDDAAAGALERRFSLPAGLDEVLAEMESLNYLAPLAQLVVGAVYPLDKLVDAFRTGDGVPFHDFGVDLHEGQGRMNRNAFLYQLGQEWLPAIPDVHARLAAGRPARIADIGCGHGWSTIGMARAYPNARVDGYDLDDASVAVAQEHVRAAGLAERVNIQARDAGDATIDGDYDLVTAFECIHDMSDPVGVLRSMRRLAGAGGTVIVMDERVGESFDARVEETEWFMYGFSVLHCLPVGMVDQPSAATGTVMRPSTLRGYALEAGFRDVEILPIENFFFNFYRLVN
jgi:2-polyprenyl-3-methyl-5-hydroxy-6-metoxy-1,4-benzoquinol methylase